MEDTINKEQMLLDGVNILLETINELPIEVETDYDLILEARQAKAKIIEVKRAVLSEGWDFNKDTHYVFPIDSEGKIPVPTNVLDITADRSDVIMRNWLLYSKYEQSHIFEEEVSCEVVWDMEFNSLSHPLRHYITIRAARVFAARTVIDSKVLQFNEVDEEDARLAARRSETRTGQHNMFKGAYGLNRRRFFGSGDLGIIGLLPLHRIR